ncbi:MAG TPA: PP2C family serine/threonine-protein phosphatase [Stellaceae bacterium]|nr:PP2C family serine/threonine-protein phosphatase [Stellaceae bacterium]
MPHDWKYALASVTGTSHKKDSLPCQDACGCRVVCGPDGKSVLLAIASDGAGSAIRSEEGARLTVNLFLDYAEEQCRTLGMAAFDRAFVDQWILSVKEEIGRYATDLLCTSREFACTALGAMVGEDEAVFFQIGDGAIVIAEHGEADEYKPIFMPQHGKFANTTNFIIQDDTPEILAFASMATRYDEVAIFTDGIERLVLNIAEHTAHVPFFRPLFEWLARTSEDSTQSATVTRYLSSGAICDRTDDDKTLILATRRARSQG